MNWPIWVIVRLLNDCVTWPRRHSSHAGRNNSELAENAQKVKVVESGSGFPQPTILCIKHLLPFLEICRDIVMASTCPAKAYALLFISQNGEFQRT